MNVSVVIPIANMSFIMALLLSVALGMEAFTRRLLAVIAAIGSIVLLAQV